MEPHSSTDATLHNEKNEFFPTSSQDRNSDKLIFDAKDDNSLLRDGVVKIFCENQDGILDELEYSREGNDAGLVIIFNQENFENNKKLQREGTRRDVNEIIQTLSRLGHNIRKDFILTDLSREEMTKKLDEISALDHTQKNSLICFVLTHGKENDKLLLRENFITSDEIIEKFTKCPSLENKPKMFVFQACKGENTSNVDLSGQYVGTNSDTANLFPKTIFDLCEPDVLIVYATVEGKVSYRDAVNGTWFIQELCRNFTAYGRRDDVISLIIRTTKCVANNYFQYNNKTSLIQKQMPLFVSTLTKKFYLTKSKDRRFLLNLKKDQEDIRALIEQLSNKIDVLSTKH